MKIARINFLKHFVSHNLPFCKAFIIALALFFKIVSIVAMDKHYSPSATDYNKDEWVYHSESQGIKIFYQISTCGKEDVVLLKFENTTPEKVTIEWEEEFWTDLRYINKGVKGRKAVLLKPGITAKLDCNSPDNSLCLTLARHVDPTRLTKILKFNLVNIQINN